MAEPDIADASPDPAVQAVIGAVRTGKIGPEEGARRLASLWVPIELARGDAPVLFLRPDSLRTWDKLAFDLAVKGDNQEARRLAELNLLLAESIGDDALRVECSATLAQLMYGDPTANRRRLFLLEFCAPQIARSDRPAEIRALILFHLAQARADNLSSEPSSYRATVEACNDALALEANLGAYQRGLLHFAAGTCHQELGDYQASIRHLEEASRLFTTDTYPDARGSVLNNLGNTYRILGEQTGDCTWLHKALNCYDQALPFREGSRLELTRNNKARAEKILQRLAGQHDGSGVNEPRDGESRRLHPVFATLAAGDAAVRRSQAVPDAEQGRQAIKYYLIGAKALGRDAPARTRAEGYHRLGYLFIDSRDTDELWTGMCFTAAASRLAAGAWRPVSMARVACHTAHMLVGIGATEGLAYLRTAASLLRTAIPVLESDGESWEPEQAHAELVTCLTLQGFLGDEGARAEAQSQLGDAHMQWIAAADGAQVDDPLRLAYRSYLQLVRKEAESALATLLGDVALAEISATAYEHLDEFNRAIQLIGIAATSRDAGDLDGAIKIIRRAEAFAGAARYSAPSVWCELALFYAGLPMKVEATRCLQRAQNVMTLVAASGEWVQPGDQTGRWMAEGPLDSYQEEIDRTMAEVEASPEVPHFDPAVTANRLYPHDESSRARLQEKLEHALRCERED